MIVEIRDEIVALSGHLRRNEWRTLEAAVKVRLRHHPHGIVVDCDGLKTVTPEGAETFRSFAANLEQSGARFVVARLPEHAVSALRSLSSVFSQLPIAETLPEARTYLGLADVTARTAPGTTLQEEDAAPILVGLLGSDADADAVAIGCLLARRERLPIYLVHVLQVPRDRPLLSAMGAEEEEARSDLLRFETAVRDAQLRPVLRIERTRAAGERLASVAQEVNARLVTLAVQTYPEAQISEIITTVTARAPCPVLVNRIPRSKAAT